MNDNLLKEILKDEILSSKYNITDEMIENAQLAPPYPNKVIEYLAIIIRSKMVDMHGDITVYNQLKNRLR